MKVNIIAQYHPAAALHNPRLWADMLEDWEHLPEKVCTDFLALPQNTPTNLNGMPIASLDTETDGAGGIGQWSVCYRDGEGRLTVAPFFGLRRDFQFGSCPVVFHNAKYDLRELQKNNFPLPVTYHDTMIAAYCLGLGKQAPKEDSKTKAGSDMIGGLGLKYLARRHLGFNMLKWADVKDHPELVPEYNAGDSVATYLLFEKWRPKLPRFYYDIDLPMLGVCMAIEDRGIQIDPSFLIEFGKELDSQLAEYEMPLNPFSTLELQSYVYGTLGVEPWKFTDGGAPSVDDEVLETMADPLIQQVLAYKKLYKEKDTYVENYVRAMGEDNRIHPEIKQTSTSTGRLSVARPNLQNVFKRDERVRVRALFVAQPCHRLVKMDYNQLDYRALAAITQDPILIKALNANKKIHQVTAEELAISYDDAKTGNYAVLFGAEAWSLSQSLHITISEAKAFLARYFEKFPNILKYRKGMTEKIEATKSATIPWTGRTRRIDAMFSDQWRIRQEGIKEGINLPVQGTEAEIVKVAMIDLHYKHAAPMVLQVHDELLFEVPEKDAVEYAHWIKDYVGNLVEINGMKFPVEVGIGRNWYEAGLKENAI